MRYLLRFPHYFGFNAETASDNEFQQTSDDSHISEDRYEAQAEFNRMVDRLHTSDIDVIVMDADEASTLSPDALFPNNWFSTHPEGILITYPMLAENRRTEVNTPFVQSLGSYTHHALELHANDKRFLEGTGSMIIDREAELIYASRSERTDEALLKQVARLLNYDSFLFDAHAPSGKPIYHTNVVMHVGTDYVCAGMDLIGEADREVFRTHVKNANKELIELTAAQVMEHFAGNMLQVFNKRGEKILLLSERAFRSLTDVQLAALKQYNTQLLPIPIPTIERIGGGSVRCMVAEIF